MKTSVVYSSSDDALLKADDEEKQRTDVVVTDRKDALHHLLNFLPRLQVDVWVDYYPFSEMGLLPVDSWDFIVRQTTNNKQQQEESKKK